MVKPDREPYDEFIQSIADRVWATAPIRIGAAKPLPAIEPTAPIPAPLEPARPALDDDDVLSIDETKARLGISRAQLQKLWAGGGGPESFYIGARRQVTGRALKAFLRKAEATSRSPTTS